MYIYIYVCVYIVCFVYAYLLFSQQVLLHLKKNLAQVLKPLTSAACQHTLPYSTVASQMLLIQDIPAFEQVQFFRPDWLGMFLSALARGRVRSEVETLRLVSGSWAAVCCASKLRNCSSLLLGGDLAPGACWKHTSSRDSAATEMASACGMALGLPVILQVPPRSPLMRSCSFSTVFSIGLRV